MLQTIEGLADRDYASALKIADTMRKRPLLL
jgi:hypothetical protein